MTRPLTPHAHGAATHLLYLHGFRSSPQSFKAQRLQAYWRARQRYIEVGARTPPDADAQRMLRRVQAPLLDVLRISPDFRPAYAPLLALAQAVAASDPARARALLLTLQAIQPARTEAAEAMRLLP